MIQWEYTGELSRSGLESVILKRPLFSKGLTSEYNPAKLLLNGVGWSIPQSQGVRGAKNLIPQRWINEVRKNPVEIDASTSNLVKLEPWFWFPSPASCWDGPDFLGRVGGLKDELPWKIRASVIYSVRAHQGALRSLAVCQDECTVFTAGIGPGFRGTIQKWDLTRINCVSGYYGHDEVYFKKILCFEGNVLYMHFTAIYCGCVSDCFTYFRLLTTSVSCRLVEELHQVMELYMFGIAELGN